MMGLHHSAIDSNSDSSTNPDVVMGWASMGAYILKNKERGTLLKLQMVGVLAKDLYI